MSHPPSQEQLLQAHQELLQRIATLETAIAGKITETRGALDRELCDPLEATLGRIAGAHREIAARFYRAVEVDDGASPGAAVRTYRDEVADRVLTPVRECFATLAAGETIATAFLALPRDFAALVAGEGDDGVLLPEADGLYLRQPGDGLPLALGKAAVRAGRSIGAAATGTANAARAAVGKDRNNPPPRTRQVPIGALVAYHLQTGVNSAIGEYLEAYEQRVAGVVAAVEDELTGWTHTVLEAAGKLDRLAVAETVPEEDAQAEAEDQVQPTVADAVGEPTDPTSLETMTQCAARLQEALERIAPDREPPVAADGALRGAFTALEQDIEKAGTFMLPADSLRIPPGSAESRTAVRVEKWSGWHQQSIDKLAFLERIILLRGELTGIRDDLLTGIAHATLDPIKDAFGSLKKLLDRCAEEARAIGSDAGGNRAEVAGRYRKLADKTSRSIKGTLGDIPGIVASDRALTAPGNAEWLRMQDLIKSLPENYDVHPVRTDSEAPISPERAPHSIKLRDITRDALDPPLPDQLKQPAAPLRQKIPHVWGETEQVLNIVQYNLGAAAEELDAEGELEHAAELAEDGIRRSIETLTELEESLRVPWGAFAGAVFDTFQGDWADLHRRVRAEAALEEKWVGMRTRIERNIESSWGEVRRWSLRRWQVARRHVLLWKVRLLRLVQRGRSAVSTAGAGEQEAYEALATIVGVDAVVDALPLVYRRLFSFGSLKEPSLFTGRVRELERLQAHFAAWGAGRNSGVAIIPAAPGSGRTSFLNVLPSKVFADADVRSVAPAARIADEASLTALLAEALNIEIPADASLNQLETELLKGRARRRPVVCLIDNLEHLLIRAPNGTDLFERTLVFFSRTDAVVYWVGTVARAAWKYVERSVPSAIASVTTYPFESFDRDTLEKIVINRHERSGMPLVFARPSDPSPLLRRRLSRAVEPEKQEAILRESYFDQAYKLCGNNITLALFYWVRSADFETRPDTLTVNSIDPVDFRFLNSLDLQRAFSLQAFVMHNTLSLEEHNRILTVSEDTGRFLLESLVRLRLVIAAPIEGGGVSQEANDVSIGLDERYQLRRLALNPVIELLRKRNIAS